MRFLRLLVVLLLSFQVLAIAAANMPADSILTPTVLRPFSTYLTWTTQWQTWNMFDTIPYDRRFEVKAFTLDSQDQQTEIGPLLPGLKPFRADLRIQTFFYRIYPGSLASNQYWETYARRLCNEAQAQAKTNGSAPVKAVLVHFISDRTRSLSSIRYDGVLSDTKVSPRGPFACDD